MTITILYPSESCRPNRVTMPVPPFQIEACSRDESSPYPRITMLKPAPRKSVENAYTKIMRAIEEASKEW